MTSVFQTRGKVLDVMFRDANLAVKIEIMKPAGKKENKRETV
jgi:hypothetical protein